MKKKVEILSSQKSSSVLTLERTESRDQNAFYENQNTESKAVLQEWFGTHSQSSHPDQDNDISNM